MEILKKLMQDKWKLLAIIAVVIIVILIIVLVTTNANKSNNSGKNNTEIVKQAEEVKEEPLNIMINEDINKSGTVEKLDNVTWDHANINQHDGQMDAFIYLRNNSAKDKVKSRKLIVTLLDKKGEKINSKEVTMPEIDINGTTNVQATFDLSEYVLVYDVAVSAK